MRRPPQTPPDLNRIYADLSPERRAQIVLDGEPTLPDGRYLHWDDLRHRQPPEGLDVRLWWASVKASRIRRSTKIVEMSSAYHADFSYVALPEVQASLHELDRRNVAEDVLTVLGDADVLGEYRIRQLLEEAISSSVLEGARPSTREVARQMVREGRAPASKDERMIQNNWHAMERVLELREEDRPLTVDDLLELHRILGEDALDVSDAAGRFRRPGEDVRVTDVEGTVWHHPPDPGDLVERVEALLRFAAADSDRTSFMHPVVRAILCHFWLAYEHPFRDGNGRMARALYYWCMLRHDYEMAEFLSISGPIDRKPNDYYLAFAYSETDAYDLTYFILHQLDVMHRALDELEAHLDARARHMRRLASAVREFDELNHRQRALLEHAIRHASDSYTIEGHARSHGVHYLTARADLANLVKRGLLAPRTVSKRKRFYFVPDARALGTLAKGKGSRRSTK